MADNFDFGSARNAIFGCNFTVYQKMALLVLVQHMPNCHPGIDRLVKCSGMSRRQVIYTLQGLETAGIVKIQRSFGRGNQYALADGWEKLLPVHDVHQCTTCTSAEDAPLPVHHVHGGSAPGAPLPVHHVHPKTELKTKLKTELKTRETRATKRTGSGSSKSKKPETELPADWQPTTEHVEFAATHAIDLAIEVMKFRGYYDGKTALSWNGRFSTWLGNAVGFAKDRGPRKRQPVQQGLAEHVVFGSVDDDPPPVALPRAAVSKPLEQTTTPWRTKGQRRGPPQPNDPNNPYLPKVWTGEEEVGT